MKKWYEDLADDKSLVIYAVLILGLAVVYKTDMAALETVQTMEKIVLPIITGLFGVAVGQRLSK